MEESYAPVKSSHTSASPINAVPDSTVKATADWMLSPERHPQQVRQLAPPPNVTPQMPRPELSRQHWQMSPADCTQGLGMDLYGTDVATMMDAGWQVSCRAIQILLLAWEICHLIYRKYFQFVRYNY